MLNLTNSLTHFNTFNFFNAFSLLAIKKNFSKGRKKKSAGAYFPFRLQFNPSHRSQHPTARKSARSTRGEWCWEARRARAPLRSSSRGARRATASHSTPTRHRHGGDMLPLLSPPLPGAAPRAGAGSSVSASATARPAVILPVAPSPSPCLPRLPLALSLVCVTRGVCRRSGAGAREQHGRLRAARRDAAGRPRPPRGRRGAGHPPRLAPQRRGPRRRQLLAGHPPPAPRARLVSADPSPFLAGAMVLRQGQSASWPAFHQTPCMHNCIALQVPEEGG